MHTRVWILTLTLLLPPLGAAATVSETQTPASAVTVPVTDGAPAQVAAPARSPAIVDLCERIDEKLSSVRLSECLDFELQESGAVSNKKTAIAFRDFVPREDSLARVLLIGGIHGDEYSSVSVVFKWLAILAQNTDPRFHWRIVPVLNPDGLLMPPRKSQRMNANGVDLNRNFPTPNWEEEAPAYWIERTRRNARRYPGPAPLSEPESAWLAEQIEQFHPDAVVSVHAPHGIVDFDGPRVPPANLGPLELRLLGTYPGSMGRYIGLHKGIPLLTVELESAFRMPGGTDLAAIWDDMIAWLDAKVITPRQLATGGPAEAEVLE